jgi:hypothetical protein
MKRKQDIIRGVISGRVDPRWIPSVQATGLQNENEKLVLAVWNETQGVGEGCGQLGGRPFGGGGYGGGRGGF